MGSGVPKWRSQHPVDERIRQLVQGARVRPEDLVAIIQRVASAPFSRETRLDKRLVGQVYLGHTLRRREDGLFGHAAKRVLLDGEWPLGTNPDEYLDDLRNAVTHPDSGVGVVRQGLDATVVIAVAAERAIDSRRFLDLGESGQLLVVLYKADRGRIVSGLRTSHIRNVQDWRHIRWLREMSW